MGIDDMQEPWLVLRGVPNDDPALGEVSAFLERVDAAYAGLSTAHCESGHLAAVTQEARTIRNGLRTSRRKTMKELFSFKTHRLLVGSVMAALIMLSGVGVASAMGGGPIAQLWPAAPLDTTSPEPAATTPLSDPTPSAPATASDEDADDQSEEADHQSEEADDQNDDADDQREEADHESDDADDDQSEHAESQSDDDEDVSSPSSDGSHDSGDDEGDESSDDDTED